MSGAAEAPVMDWSQKNLTEAFKLGKQKMNIYFQINGKKGEEQIPYILKASNDEGLRRYNTFQFTEQEKKDPKLLWSRFEDQLRITKPNFRAARLDLHYYYQKKEETLDEFVTRCKTKSAECDFSKEEEIERIIEQILASTPIPEFQKFLLDKPKGYPLTDVLAEGRKHETAFLNIKMIKESRGAAGGASTNTEISFIKKKNVCLRCGKDHARTRNACPAINSKCYTCGKIGHWEQCCLANKKKPQRGHSLSRNRDQRGRSLSRNRDQRRPNKDRSQSRGRFDKPKKEKDYRKKPIHTLKYYDDSDSDSSTYDNIDYSMITVDSMQKEDMTERKEAFVFLRLKSSSEKKQRYRLKAKVDSGAAGNTLPVRIFKKMFPDQVDEQDKPIGLDPVQNATLWSYSDNKIQCYGTLNLQIRSDDKKEDFQTAKFYVVDVQGPACIGLVLSQKLGLITLHCSVTQDEPQKSHERNTSTKPVLNNTKELIAEYPEQFDKVGNFPDKAHISVKEGSQPYIDPPRKWKIHMRESIEEELQRMEKMGVIRKVTQHTDWWSSFVASTKSDGSLRICLDPKKLNEALKRCPHKIPTLDEISYKLNSAKYFSKLDAKTGYWSVNLDEESQLLTTFRTPNGRYCFCKLPFGLSVSQDIFQARMDNILEQCPGTIGIADDVIVYGATEDEHNKNLHNLMNVANKSGLMFNSKKCVVKQPEISFFGMIYGKDGVKPDPKKVHDLKKMPTPESKKQLEEFLGLINYLSLFIKNLASESSALRDLTKQDVPFEWQEDHEYIYQKLKNMICEDAKLKFYDPKAPLQLQVDASMRGLGACLLQPDKDDNGHYGSEYRPVAYASKSLSPTQSRYANIEREMLAVTFGIKRFEVYLYGRQFEVVTDHKPLIMICQKPLHAAPSRLQKMLVDIQGYNFKITHHPGKTIGLVDSLSRLLNPEDKKDIKLDVRVVMLNFSENKIKDIQQCTREDSVLCELIETIIVGWPENIKQVPTDIRQYWSYRDELAVENGVILKGERVFIPEPLRKKTLNILHTGHLGIEKTRLRARRDVYWPNIHKDIERMCKECQTCQEYMPSQSHEKLQPTEVPTDKWQILGTDLFSIGQDNYLIVADYFTKYPYVEKLPNPAPSEVVVNATRHLFGQFGILRKVISDNGPHYASKAYSDFARDWNFCHETSSPRYPQGNGFIERQIQTVKRVIKKAQQSNQDVELALLGLRNTPFSNKLSSPGELLFGRKLNDKLFTYSKIKDLDNIKSELQKRQDSQKQYHDKHARELPPLYTGQHVRVQNQDTGKWEKATIQEKVNPQSILKQAK